MPSPPEEQHASSAPLSAQETFARSPPPTAPSSKRRPSQLGMRLASVGSSIIAAVTPSSRGSASSTSARAEPPMQAGSVSSSSSLGQQPSTTPPSQVAVASSVVSTGSSNSSSATMPQRIQGRSFHRKSGGAANVAGLTPLSYIQDEEEQQQQHQEKVMSMPVRATPEDGGKTHVVGELSKSVPVLRSRETEEEEDDDEERGKGKAVDMSVDAELDASPVGGIELDDAPVTPVVVPRVVQQKPHPQGVSATFPRKAKGKAPMSRQPIPLYGATASGSTELAKGRYGQSLAVGKREDGSDSVEDETGEGPHGVRRRQGRTPEAMMVVGSVTDQLKRASRSLANSMVSADNAFVQSYAFSTSRMTPGSRRESAYDSPSNRFSSVSASSGGRLSSYEFGSSSPGRPSRQQYVNVVVASEDQLLPTTSALQTPAASYIPPLAIAGDVPVVDAVGAGRRRTYSKLSAALYKQDTPVSSPGVQPSSVVTNIYAEDAVVAGVPDEFVPEGFEDDMSSIPLLPEEPQREGSSVSQSIFNCLNLLVGIGFLSLPYAMRAGGWIPGLAILVSTAFVCNYTGHILAKCLEYRPAHAPHLQMFSFADVAEVALGARSRTLIASIFLFELFFTCVAFIILISDSLHAIFPDIDIAYLRGVAFVVCTLISWVRKLNVISYASLIGVLASINLIVVVLFNGVAKKERPGSLWDPEDTYLVPENPLSVSLTFGIMFAGYAGHAVLPSIYLDMKDRKKYPVVLNVSFSIAAGIYVLIACAGYLMFGELTLEEITKNLADPKAAVVPTLNIITTSLICFIPVPKFALTMAPVSIALDQFIASIMYRNSSAESAPLLAAEASSDPHGGGPSHYPPLPRPIQLVNRAVLAFLTTVVPFFLPHFDVVLALLGSIFSFVVSVVLPSLFYLQLFWWEPRRMQKEMGVGVEKGAAAGAKVGMGRGEMVGNVLLVGIGSVVAIAATVAELLPGVRPE
ncbi:transmembrane amino acid transporter protein-domain-containing protein [Cladochytrium replicatum]|nr:transmembrane amino acid transporter protein-domain-containing protein [Cladochytrium replicatum]